MRLKRPSGGTRTRTTLPELSNEQRPTEPFGQGTVRRKGATPTTSIRLDPEDILRARVLADRKGLRYQTYLKMLIREALIAEEKKLAG